MFTVFDILKLLGAIGLFLYGMKVMSDGIQKVAGARMRKFLEAMSAKPGLGVLTGFGITAIIQSSSATTVMIVSFVNAGMLSVSESIGLIMGANIGTTVTGWLVALFGLKWSITSFVLPVFAVAIPMLFSKRSNIKSWGEFLIGLSLLFLGLEMMRSSTPDFNSNASALRFIKNYSYNGFFSLLLLILIGCLLTALIQSSSAAMAITLVLCNEGWIDFHSATAIILGENIGTTITANLAAIVANVKAKRSARSHTIFNVIGVLWMLPVFPFVVSFIDSFLISINLGSPIQETSSIPVALALFHSLFNISNTLLLLWFLTYIEKIACLLVPDKNGSTAKHTLDYLSAGLVATPELSLLEAKKEIIKYGQIDRRIFGYTHQLLETTEKPEAEELFLKIAKYEDITDKMEVEIADYLMKIAEGEISDKTSITIRSHLVIVANLERIADICFQMSKVIERKLNERTWFTPEQRNNLSEMFLLVEEAMDIMLENLSNEYDVVSAVPANNKETQINLLRNKLRVEHYESIQIGTYDLRSGMIYFDLFSSLEKLGDQIINVTEAIKGGVG